MQRLNKYLLTIDQRYQSEEQNLTELHLQVKIEMEYQTIKEDCEVVGIQFENIKSITIKDIIHAYRRKALKVRDEEKEKAKEAFQALNHSYERLLKFLVEKAKGEGDLQEHGDDNEESEESKFTEEYFKHFNFPTQNDGSFTVNIQHYQADAWQDSLEKLYGTPIVHKTSKGTDSDTFWQFKYSVEETETLITLHIYNKPLNKRRSKLMIRVVTNHLCVFMCSLNSLESLKIFPQAHYLWKIKRGIQIW